MIESISVFSERSITKNASIVLATPIYLGKCGPDTEYYADLSASGGGITSISYLVGMTPDDVFFAPSNASKICASFLSSMGTASRDYFTCNFKQAPWLKFKAKENNASPVTVNFNLVIAK